MIRKARLTIAWLFFLPCGCASLAAPPPSFASASFPSFLYRPFADYEPSAAVVMGAFDGYDTATLRREIARQLPEPVVLVLYGDDRDPAAERRVIEDYSRFLRPERIRYLTFPRTRNMFWPRDSMPIPVIDERGGLALAGSKYWGRFEPDRTVAGIFAAPLREQPLPFEGGNLLANHLGECFTVDSRAVRAVTDEMFRTLFGCRNLTRLPRRGGIGHVDERAQFLDARTIVTDTPEYAAVFRARGLTVTLMPRGRGSHESYVNSLLVNGVAFVPQFDRPEDAAALRLYRDAGYHAVGLPARTLASKGRGLIHCLTRTYPALP